MRKFINKILLRILGDAIYSPGVIDEEAMHNWLLTLSKNKGFKSYYTMRKKFIVSTLALGLEGKEQWTLVGRLEELKSLAGNIDNEIKRAAAKRVKKELEDKLEKEKG